MDHQHLNKLDIKYEIIKNNHLNIINLLFQDSNKDYYYMIKQDDTKVNIQDLAKQICTSKLSIVPTTTMEVLLNAKTGYLTIFCLINKQIDNLTILLDSRMLPQDEVTFYDLSRTQFIKLQYKDVLLFIESLNLPTFTITL